MSAIKTKTACPTCNKMFISVKQHISKGGCRTEEQIAQLKKEAAVAKKYKILSGIKNRRLIPEYSARKIFKEAGRPFSGLTINTILRHDLKNMYIYYSTTEGYGFGLVIWYDDDESYNVHNGYTPAVYKVIKDAEGNMKRGDRI